SLGPTAIRTSPISGGGAPRFCHAAQAPPAVSCWTVQRRPLTSTQKRVNRPPASVGSTGATGEAMGRAFRASAGFPAESAPLASVAQIVPSVPADTPIAGLLLGSVSARVHRP